MRVVWSPVCLRRAFWLQTVYWCHGGMLVVASRSSPLPPNPLLPMGERAALSGQLTRDTWFWHLSEAARGYRGRNARAPPLKAGCLALRAPLSTTGELGGENGAFTTRRKVSAANKTKQNAAKQRGSLPAHYRKMCEGNWGCSNRPTCFASSPCRL